jgi:hypothetical protein
MKKMFFIILAVMLTGCINPDSSNVPVVQRYETMYIEYADGLHRAITPVHFDYNGHKYITFMGSQSHSTVHDPDCDCYLKHKNNDY